LQIDPNATKNPEVTSGRWVPFEGDDRANKPKQKIVLMKGTHTRAAS